MIVILCSIILALTFWLGGFAIYMLCNHGLAPNARLQQFLRYMAAAFVAVLPMCVTMTSYRQPVIALILIVSVAWMITFPLTYHLTNRKTSPDYDNQIDVAFGIYLFGWITGLLLIPYIGAIIGLVMAILLFIPLAQWVYFFMYHAVISDSGMKLIQDTDYNETIEFIRSYPVSKVIAVVILVLTATIACISFPIWQPLQLNNPSWWQIVIALGIVIFISIYLWKSRHGLFVRTGIVLLYKIVRDYVAQNSQYASLRKEKVAKMEAHTLHSLNQPHTLLMVIGESASRDFMSAFTEMEEDTTPWLRTLSEDRTHCVIFPHAYSCDIQTVPTLEKVLTEYNQYDGGDFYSACSIVDMAQKLGYRVHWYSNQGHIGVADTPITLVANMADTAKWTRQELNQVQYDEALLELIQEVDPKDNNLIVLHLMGSHFNYENRFPPQYRKWGEEGNHDKITNYKNTLYFTDSVLRRAFDYCRKELNLQTMVYFSDHADVPDRHRQPNFGGFRDTRIPLMIWMGDDFLEKRPKRAEALKKNSQRYWTNDLTYELLCGLMDAESPHFKESNSLASEQYDKQREQLTAMNGRIRIVEDNPPCISY